MLFFFCEIQAKINKFSSFFVANGSNTYNREENRGPAPTTNNSQTPSQQKAENPTPAESNTITPATQNNSPQQNNAVTGNAPQPQRQNKGPRPDNNKRRNKKPPTGSNNTNATPAAAATASPNTTQGTNSSANAKPEQPPLVNGSS